MPDISDRELIKNLFETYRQAMYKVALGILHNSHDAEDAVQNAFLSIINNLNKISLIPCNERVFYFVKITENASIDILKKQNKHPAEDISEHEIISSDGTAEEKAIGNITVEEIKEALKELSERDYSILYCYLFKQMKPKEISEALGIPECNIHVYLKRARERFTKILKQRGYDYDF